MWETHPWGRAGTQERGKGEVYAQITEEHLPKVGVAPASIAVPQEGSGQVRAALPPCSCCPTAPAQEGRVPRAPAGLSEPNQRLEVLAEQQRVGEDTETTLPWLRGDYLITALQMHTERAPSTLIQATFAAGSPLLLQEPH